MVSSINTPDIIYQPIANNGDKNSIPQTESTESASQPLGFPPLTSERIADGGRAVKRADMNGLFNLLSQHNYFQQLGGLYTFNQDLSNALGGYPLGAILWYKDPTTNEISLVQSLKANNTANFVTNPTFIDNVNWKLALSMPEIGDNFVTLDTEQTITGRKEFVLSALAADKTNKNLRLHNNSMPMSGNPTADQYSSIQFCGQYADIKSFIRQYYYDNGNIGLQLQANNSSQSSTSFTYLDIINKADGTKQTLVSTCQNSGAILNLDALSLTDLGYIKLGVGVMIQWGSIENAPQDSTTNVTFKKAFSSICRVITQGATVHKEYTNGNAVYNLKTTGFTCFSFNSGGWIGWIAIGY